MTVKSVLYLKILREKYKFGVRNVEAHYNALCNYLKIGLEKKTVDQLISACKLNLKKIPKRFVRRMDMYRSSLSKNFEMRFASFVLRRMNQTLTWPSPTSSGTTWWSS